MGHWDGRGDPFARCNGVGGGGCEGGVVGGRIDGSGRHAGSAAFAFAVDVATEPEAAGPEEDYGEADYDYEDDPAPVGVEPESKKTKSVLVYGERGCLKGCWTYQL